MTLAVIFVSTLVISALFAMGGAGSAIALVPALGFLTVPFNLAKVIGLFVATSSTVTASYLNFRRKVLDLKFAIPLIISGLIAAPLGARSSMFFDEKIVEIVLVVFLIISGFLLIFYRKSAEHIRYKKSWVLYLVGGLVGFFAGMLGIGGGSILAPILIFLGYDAKKVAIAISLVVPFSSLGALLSYLSYVHVDWMLFVLAITAAVLGGAIGNRLMHSKLEPHHIKQILGIILWALAASLVPKII